MYFSLYNLISTYIYLFIVFFGAINCMLIYLLSIYLFMYLFLNIVELVLHINCL